MKAIFLVLASAVFTLIFTVQAQATSVVDELAAQGFKFVLVATKGSTDLVLVNEEANNLEFNFGTTICQTKIFSKEDPVYPGETLGVLKVTCESNGVKITSSASCSSRFQNGQSHLEVGEGEGSYVLDILCRVKAL